MLDEHRSMPSVAFALFTPGSRAVSNIAASYYAKNQLIVYSRHALHRLENHIHRSFHMCDHRTMPTIHLDHINSRPGHRFEVVNHLLLVLRYHDEVRRALEVGDGNVVVACTGHATTERSH